MTTHLRAAFMSLGLLMILTGVLYPLAVTGVAQWLFPRQANGSLIEPFDDPKYFWGRPSATGPFPYNAAASSGSNLGPTNDALTTAVKDRIAALNAADPGNSAPVPVDLVTASGSGLDPHISLAAADYQVHRVAKIRGLDDTKIRALVEAHTEGRRLGLLGEPRVNVLWLNLALDASFPR